jgi:cyclopropane fatty-acyl-phospholipid synthase-like methyltransferase
MKDSPLYRDFYYPLNVLLHVLTLEEGDVRHLHYGLFEGPVEGIGAAQERASARILGQLPPPPARVLDVGSGLGSNLSSLVGMGYDVTGITPDAHQIAAIRSRYGDLPLRCERFEDVTDTFDVALFHESSQYIASEALFAKAEEIAPGVLVLDEFAMKPVEGLHRYDEFVAAAERHRFAKVIDEDVSAMAAPTIDYFNVRLPRFRQRLIDDLGVSSVQIDELIASGERYRDRYRNGDYGYRFLRFARVDEVSERPAA